MENKKVIGNVQAVAQRAKNYGLKIADVWYSGFGECPCIKGDVVEVEYVDKKIGDQEYRDIVGAIHVISKTEKEGEKIGSKEVADAVESCKAIMQQCKKATDEVFGSDAKYKDSIGTHCNSMFIEVCRRI